MEMSQHDNIRFTRQALQKKKTKKTMKNVGESPAF